MHPLTWCDLISFPALYSNTHLQQVCLQRTSVVLFQQAGGSKAPRAPHPIKTIQTSQNKSPQDVWHTRDISLRASPNLLTPLTNLSVVTRYQMEVWKVSWKELASPQRLHTTYFVCIHQYLACSSTCICIPHAALPVFMLFFITNDKFLVMGKT